MLIQAKNYTLEISDKTGNILSFRGITGYDYIEKETSLIRLSLLKSDGERVVLNSGKCRSIERRGEGIVVRYENIGGFEISVDASFYFDDSNFIKMRLKLNNFTDMRTECVLYPGIIIKNRLSADGYKLFWPAMEGVEIDTPDFRSELMAHADGTVYPAKGWQGVYPGACPMQFMAYYNGEHGMYFASHDENCRFKLVEWIPEEGGIRLLQQVYVDEDGREFSYDYDVVLGVFRGNWYDAAEIYRQWLSASKILDIPKLKDNPELPSWMTQPLTVITFPIRGCQDTGEMFANGYYPYTNCLPYIRKYEEFFGNRQMVLLMHWEGTAPWAPPYVWPPFGDKTNFDKLVEGIHGRNNLFGLYCSGLGWTQKSFYYDYNREDTFEKESLAECVEVGPMKKLQYTTTCFHIRNGYDLCPACEKVKNIAVREAEKISSQTNVDYLQFFDQDLGGNTYPCYSDKHGHPPVPGKWMAEEMTDVVDKMYEVFKKERPEKKMLIGCEAAACEPLIGKMRFNDLRYNLDLMYGIPVPAYAYMFGEYVVNYMGNHTTATRLLDTRLYPDNIFYRTAYSFAQGDVLTFMLKNDGKVNWEWNVPWKDDDEPDQEAYLSFSKMLNDFRNGLLSDVLRFGKMVKPKTVICGKYTEKVDRKNLVRILDEIVTTRFVTEEGRDVQIFVNFNRRAVSFAMRGNIAGRLYRFPTDEGKIISCENPEFDMPAHSAVAIEFAKGEENVSRS